MKFKALLYSIGFLIISGCNSNYILFHYPVVPCTLEAATRMADTIFTNGTGKVSETWETETSEDNFNYTIIYQYSKKTKLEYPELTGWSTKFVFSKDSCKFISGEKF